jgi:hypothetical protein
VKSLVAWISSFLLLLALLPAAAPAADSIWWANDDGSAKLAFANLDGSGAADLIVPDVGTRLLGPQGLAIDASAGRVYWTNAGQNKISFANLDGSGVGDLNTTGATFSFPFDLALDRAHGLIYWSNLGDTVTSTISFARLDGRGGGDITITGERVAGTFALDTTAGRVYWVKFTAQGRKIAFVNLDGSPGGTLADIGTATIDDSSNGIAIDPVAHRIYWGNSTSIAFANLEGGGGGAVLDTTNATVRFPEGVAIDPVGRRVYWANNGAQSIGFASLDGTGSNGTLTPAMTTLSSPVFPVLLAAPRAVAPPAVTSGTAVGATLSCSQGTWAADVVEAHYYRAPQSFSYQWSRDGTDIVDATQSTLTANTAGDYRCRVTATNHAGSAAQTSEPYGIVPSPGGPGPGPTGPGPSGPAAFGSLTRVTATLAVSRIPARGPLPVRIANANAFAIAGTLSAQTSKPVGARRVKLRPKAFKLAANARATIKLALPKSLQRQLARRHRLSFAVSVVVVDPAGHRRTVRRTIVVALRPAR